MEFPKPSYKKTDPEEGRRIIKQLYGEQYEPEDINGRSFEEIFIMQAEKGVDDYLKRKKQREDQKSGGQE